jgi:hypothetical protein
VRQRQVEHHVPAEALAVDADRVVELAGDVADGVVVALQELCDGVPPGLGMTNTL